MTSDASQNSFWPVAHAAQHNTAGWKHNLPSSTYMSSLTSWTNIAVERECAPSLTQRVQFNCLRLPVYGRLWHYQDSSSRFLDDRAKRFSLLHHMGDTRGERKLPLFGLLMLMLCLDMKRSVEPAWHRSRLPQKHDNIHKKTHTQVCFLDKVKSALHVKKK